MPRYYIDTDNGFPVHDEEGHTYSDAETLRRAVRRSLALMIHDAQDGTAESYASAAVRDEAGRCVMQATLVLSVSDGERTAPD